VSEPAGSTGPLVLRADASTAAGTGHVMRCLALAQAWMDAAGGRCLFVQAEGSPRLSERIVREGAELATLDAAPGSLDDAARTVALAREHGASWIVVDGYHFDGAYQRALREAGLRVLSIDDNAHASHYFADLVLNQNLHADEGLYAAREPYTRLLLGADYLLLRRRFQAWNGWTRAIAKVARRVLVTFGGSDPQGRTAEVLEALAHAGVPDLQVKVVVGPAHRPSERLARAVERLPGVELLSAVEDMAALMAWADVALSAAGSTLWELAFMRLPHLALVCADNQEPAAARLQARGFLVWRGPELADPVAAGRALRELMLDQGLRRRLSELGGGLVGDAAGGTRVVHAILGAR
jgi:UDP-2,4-diacetamido-2,4,6-trideoxy-beta-L-altropyranose hydrolase